ncbi:MAG: beta-galactosidase [Ruminococcus sp.]
MHHERHQLAGLSKLKSRGCQLSVIEAVARGRFRAYFQLRQSRGSCEKFLGGHLQHRHGKHPDIPEVTDIGAVLEQLSDRVYGSGTGGNGDPVRHGEMGAGQMPGAEKSGWTISEYPPELQLFLENGINVDIIDSTFDLSG